MKRSVVLGFGLVALVAAAAVVAFVIGSRHKAAIGDNTNVAAKPGAGGGSPRGTGAKLDDAKPAGRSPSPEWNPDLERRRTAWIRLPLSQQENQMTPERVRRMEMSRFELSSLAQEAAAIGMGLGEGERVKLRQLLADYRNAVLLRIEHPADAKDRPAPTGHDPLEGIEKRPDAPTSPGNVYRERMRAALGERRYAEYERLERQERSKLIEQRQAFRSTGESSARGQAR
jgi:hypothetical protein